MITNTITTDAIISILFAFCKIYISLPSFTYFIYKNIDRVKNQISYINRCGFYNYMIT